MENEQNKLNEDIDNENVDLSNKKTSPTNNTDRAVDGKKNNVKRNKKKKLKKEPLSPMQKWSRFMLVISIILVAVALLPFFSTLVVVIVIIAMVLALIFSLLTLMLNENFSNFLTNAGNIGEESFKLIAYSPYVLFGASVFMAGSLLLTILNKNLTSKRTSIIVKSTFLALMIAAAIIIEVLKNKIATG